MPYSGGESEGRVHMPPAASRGGAERGCSKFLRHKIYNNFVCSVEAEMGNEEQIMCIEQCTFWMSSVAFLGRQNAPKLLAAEASPQTPLGELTALPQTPGWV